MRSATFVATVVLGLAGCDQLFGLTEVEQLEPDAAPMPTALIQAKALAMATALELSLKLDTPPTPGNVLVMVGASDRFALMSPRGGGVAAWLLGAGSSTITNLEIWYGVSDGSGSDITIECNCTDPGDMRLSVSEWSGLDPKTPFDVGVDGYGTALPTATVGPLTTAHRPDLLILGVSAAGNIAPTVMGDGTWMTMARVSAGSTTMATWYQLVAEAGVYAPTVTVSGPWDTALVALRAL